jgi:SPP1 gp7 family putative phage head morphogenesis protein
MVNNLGTIHVNAVKALIDTSDMYVKASLDWMERVAIQSLEKTIQEKLTQELAKWVLKWESISEMKRGAIDLLQSEHITEFQDRAWRYRSMDRYAEMLVRTETNRANTQGTINRAIQIWITKFQIVEQPDCCEVCAEMNGDIVDISQGTVDLPPFHPNCRWYIIAQV